MAKLSNPETEAKNNYKKFIKNDICTFYKDIDVLRMLIRYQNCPRINNESVAEHSFYVAAFVLKLREYYNFNLEKALKIALIHDMPEAKISDVPHNIKENYPFLEEALNKAEEHITSLMFFDEGIQMLKEFNNGESLEGLICQFADIISVVVYANDEIKCGNRVFNYIAIKAIARCRELIDKLKDYRNPNYSQEQIINKINQIVNIY